MGCRRSRSCGRWWMQHMKRGEGQRQHKTSWSWRLPTHQAGGAGSRAQFWSGKLEQCNSGIITYKCTEYKMQDVICICSVQDLTKEKEELIKRGIPFRTNSSCMGLHYSVSFVNQHMFLCRCVKKLLRPMNVYVKLKVIEKRQSQQS